MESQLVLAGKLTELEEQVKNLKKYYQRAKEKVRERDRKVQELQEYIKRWEIKPQGLDCPNCGGSGTQIIKSQKQRDVGIPCIDCSGTGRI